MWYGNNDYRDYLAHHGVLGMEWGKRNGPPYPLAPGAHSAAEKEAGWRSSLTYEGRGDLARKKIKKQKIERQKAQVESLSKELNEQWDYGVLHKGEHILDTSSFNFGKDYRTTPVETLEKEKIGTCWDFVNYQHKKLKEAGIKDSAYMLVMDLSTKDDPDHVVTHTFSTYELDGKKYWLESAMWPKRGVHEIKDLKDVSEQVKSNYTSEKHPYQVYQYDPEGMDQGLTDKEFYKRATQNRVLDSRPEGPDKTMNPTYEGFGALTRKQRDKDLKPLYKAKSRDLDKWGKDADHNILFLTGLSGSGKSTVARHLMKKANADVIHLDLYLDMGDDPDDAYRSKGFNKYLDKHVKDWRKVAIPNTNKLDWNKVDQIADASEAYSRELYKKGKKLIIDGVQLRDETFHPDKNFYKDKPYMNLSTSPMLSLYRSSVRDGNNLKFAMSRIPNYIKGQKLNDRLVKELALQGQSALSMDQLLDDWSK